MAFFFDMINRGKEIQHYKKAVAAGKRRCQRVLEKHPLDWWGAKAELIERKIHLEGLFETYFDKVILSQAQIHAREELKEINSLINDGVDYPCAALPHKHLK